jgi:LmbE family N-acetylglucosaminyl deacetylase
MMGLKLQPQATRPLNVLCIGAHSDDIEIGCGGTVLRLAREYPDAVFHWLVLSAIGVREAEARKAAGLFAGEQIGELLLKSFPDGFMPYVGAEIKGIFELLKATVEPDVILCTSKKDAHQDHRLVAELTWNTFRNHLILEYEIPKYDGDMGQPSVFVPLESTIYRQKISNLMAAFESQRSKHWFEEDTFLAMMRLRGMECNSASGYAEAFYCRKLTL